VTPRATHRRRRLTNHPTRDFALRAFAYGVRHPTGMTASVYVIADHRLNTA